MRPKRGAPHSLSNAVLPSSGENQETTSALTVNGKNIPVAPQPPYSSDLSPCDFFLFPKLKNHLKGHHFGTLENIQTAVTDQLKAIPIPKFHQCYEEWKKRLQRCVASEGSYFEGDNVELARGHGTTPLKVKEDIEDVSRELWVKGCTSWMKRPELYCSRRVRI
ncbi:putative transposase [Trichonephila clavipes]|uniref:Putative transposase n=1 Tax=Trichonephila clavipes TaxID=2585209 RepID=A0A8X6RBD3_TRICX|nr:putative transposase [Trichonephila clavipes]